MRLFIAYSVWIFSSALLGLIFHPFMSPKTMLATGQVDVCQTNCEDANRLAGPRRMEFTKPHPWKQAVFPTKLQGFCKMGCQLFFAEFPKNTTCKRMCDYYYRTRNTVGYCDIAENAILECRDGCEIALAVCQPGFYCTEGQMMPCDPGTFREGVKDLSIRSLEATSQCLQCPPGRYRPANRGKSADDCTQCPIGKFANIPGSVLVSDCKRCPAGKNAEETGMAECKCITSAGKVNSCDTLGTGGDGSLKHYYAADQSGQSVDYYRETTPFIGRW